MKRVMFFLAVILSLSIVMVSTMVSAQIDAAFTENFEDDLWTDAKTATVEKMGYTGGHNSNATIINENGNKSLGVKKGTGIKKTFTTPFTGQIAITYDMKLSAEYTNRENGTTEIVGTIMRLHLTNSSDVTKACDVTFSNGKVSFAGGSLLEETVTNSNVKLLINTETDTIKITFNKSDNGVAEYTCDIPSTYGNVVSLSAIELLGDTVSGLGGTTTDPVNYYAQYDNVALYNKTPEVLPALTYVSEDFADESADGLFEDNKLAMFKYNNGNGSGQFLKILLAATDETGTSFMSVEEGKLKVYVENSSGFMREAVLPLPEILDGIVEITFDAKTFDVNGADFSYISLYNSETGQSGGRVGSRFGTIYLHRPDSNGENINVNHIYGQSGGAMVTGFNSVGEHSYKIIVDVANEVFNLYIDDAFYGEFKFVDIDTDPNFKYISFVNLEVDNIVVRKADKMREFGYSYVLADGETAPKHNNYNALSDFAGKKLVTSVSIANETDDYTQKAVLISAIYDNKGVLIDSIIGTSATLTTPSTRLTAIHNINLPDDTTGYVAKAFIFDALGTMRPICNYLELR